MAGSRSERGKTIGGRTDKINYLHRTFFESSCGSQKVSGLVGQLKTKLLLKILDLLFLQTREELCPLRLSVLIDGI